VILLLTMLVSRLWDLQVFAADHYRSLARADFVRDVVLPATRGHILDRTGKLVVDNQASWSVLVDPSHLVPAYRGQATDRR
jgi:penicillin-binding protein 2